MYVYMISYYKHLFPTYFCFDPFKLLSTCFNIWLELANKFLVFN